ncbi:MAG TPA: ubiquinol-cytochrome C chaperone family protein [Xanthobacteraceae bacterium]|nr:ubiquinol-cytochrome C chaperone family protein [Xanthobacteraceae bacterium]
MILNLFRRTPREDTIAVLYGAIVAQARVPAFYRNYGVPDTSNGRLEMIVLHTILVLCRLETEGGSGPPLGQALFDYFCADVDGNLREMGVGDMAVPRKMKAVAEAFYGRKRAYEAALAAPGLAELTTALGRNVYPEAGETAEATRLAAYMREAVDKLAAVDGAALLRGQVGFPDPATVAAPQPEGAP